MPLLSARFELREIRDVEGFVSAIVQQSDLVNLGHADRDDLTAYLISEAWILSLEFDAAGGSSFSTHAGARLRLKLVDWRRQRFGRTRWTFGDGRVHERKRPRILGIDEAGVRELVDALGTRNDDRAPDSDAALRRLFRDRDRERARDLETLGLNSPRRTA